MFFQRVEDLRIDNDKTQKDIAEVLNCQQEVYRRYEKGTYELPIWTLIKLASSPLATPQLFTINC